MAQVPQNPTLVSLLAAVHEAENQPVSVHVAAAVPAPEENNIVPSAPPVAQKLHFSFSCW